MQNLTLYNGVLDELAKRMARDCGMEIMTARRLIETMGLNVNSERLMEIVTIADNLTDDPDQDEKVRALELQNGAYKKVLDGLLLFWAELKAARTANVPSGEFREDDNRWERVRVAEQNLSFALDAAHVVEKPKCVCGGIGLGVACELGCPSYVEKRIEGGQNQHARTGLCWCSKFHDM
jgi:hypothetical protein